jgi:hypothetical protein
MVLCARIASRTALSDAEGRWQVSSFPTPLVTVLVSLNQNESQRDSVTEPRVAPPGATLGQPAHFAVNPEG